MIKTCEKKCPLGFDNLNIQNVLLIILTLKTIWGMFKDNGPELNIEDLLMNKIPEQILPISKLMSNLPLGDLMSNLSTMNCPMPMPNCQMPIPNCSMSMPNCPMPKTSLSCTSSFSISKIFLLGILIYLIFFIRDIFENFNFSCIETVVDMNNSVDMNKSKCEKKCKISKCPFNFGENTV